MVNFKSKRRYATKGYRSFRQPKVYGGHKTKEKIQLKFPSWAIKTTCILIVLIGIVYFFFFSDFFQIKDFFVDGNNLLKSEEIIATIPGSSNIFLFNSEKAKSDLLGRFPEIKDLEIYRGIPNAIKITVLERDSNIIWQSGNDKYLVSSEGNATRKIDDEAAWNVPKVIDKKNIEINPGDQIVSPSFIGFVKVTYNNFYEATNIKPTFFEVEDTTFDVVLHTEAGFYVKLSTLRSSKIQLENLKKILVEKRNDIHEYVDLRIEGWAYYK